MITLDPIQWLARLLKLLTVILSGTREKHDVVISMTTEHASLSADLVQTAIIQPSRWLRPRVLRSFPLLGQIGPVGCSLGQHQVLLSE
jgi:hypothetical protein